MSSKPSFRTSPLKPRNPRQPHGRSRGSGFCRRFLLDSPTFIALTFFATTWTLPCPRPCDICGVGECREPLGGLAQTRGIGGRVGEWR